MTFGSIIPGAYNLSHEGHGGSCCGITHLYGFPQAEVNDDLRRKYIQKGISDVLDDQDIDPDCDEDEYDDWDEAYAEARASHSHAIEVVITADQALQWRKPLEECGFKEVYSFRNSNSGNTCHVFYLTTGQ